jgi:hypothetical protein
VCILQVAVVVALVVHQLVQADLAAVVPAILIIIQELPGHQTPVVVVVVAVGVVLMVEPAHWVGMEL